MSNGSDWYIDRAGQKGGPYSWPQMLQFAQQGRLHPQDGVWSAALGRWMAARDVPGLFAVSSPPAASAAPRAKAGVNRLLFLGVGCGVVGLVAVGCFLLFWLLSNRQPDTRQTRLGVLTVDSSGGIFEQDDLKLAVSPGTAGSLKFTVSREDGSTAVAEEGVDYRSDGYILSGPLQSLNGQMEISLAVPAAQLSAGDVFIVLEETVISPSYGTVTGLRLLPTTTDSSAGVVTAVLDLQPQDGVGALPGLGLLAAVLPQTVNPATTSLTLRAESGWVYDMISSPHFRISYRGKVVDRQMVEEGAAVLEAQRQKIIDLGLPFTGADRLDVYLLPLKDKAGQFVPSKLGVGSCTLQLANRFFYDADFFQENHTDLLATSGHELLHLAQFIADPRWAYTKAVDPLPTLWVDEATATWFEPLAVDDPNYLPPNAVENANFIQTPLFAPMLEQAQGHGYGASFFIRRLAWQCGDDLVAEIYRQLGSGTSSGTANEALVAALRNKCDTFPGLEWVSFLETYYTAPQNLFPDFGGPVVEKAAVLTAAASPDGSDFTISFTPNQQLAASAAVSAGMLVNGPPASISIPFSLGGLSADAVMVSMAGKGDALAAFVDPGQVVVAVDAPQDAGVLVYGILNGSREVVPLAGAPFAYLSSGDSSAQGGSRLLIENVGLPGAEGSLGRILLIPFNSRSNFQNPEQTAAIQVQITYMGGMTIPPLVETMEPEQPAPTAETGSSHVCAGMTLETLKSPLQHTSRCWLTCFGIGSGSHSDAEIQSCIDTHQ